MFSETFEEVLRELEGFNYKIFWSHGKSLPECFEKPTERALKDPDVYAVLYIEDDMILPKGILKEMFAQEYPVVAVDYPFKNNGDSTMMHDPEDGVYWSGTGLLLVAKSVLESMERPIWRTNTAWDMMIRGRTLNFWPRQLKKVAYGLHDVNFGMTLYASGLPIHDTETTAGQRKLVKLGQANTNNGQHEIKELHIVGRDMVIKTFDPNKISKYREALGRVERVEIRDSIPEWIEYIDGQATYKPGGAEYV